jgi:hypothetical protein
MLISGPTRLEGAACTKAMKVFIFYLVEVLSKFLNSLCMFLIASGGSVVFFLQGSHFHCHIFLLGVLAFMNY